MKYKLFLSALLLSAATALPAQNAKAVWSQPATGVWKATFGQPEAYNLLSELDVHPKIDVINQMKSAALPFDKDSIRVTVVDGKTYLCFPLDKEEQIYGMGLNFQTVNQRGRILRLHVDHYGGEDNGRTHAPVPFFVSSRGYGAFINSARYIDCYIGSNVRKDSKNPPEELDRNTDKNWSAQPYSDNLELLIPAQGVELYLYAGPSMLDVVRRFNLMNGGGTLPPKWGLGFWQRVPSLYTAKQVEEEVDMFQQKHFPLSVIGLEPGWMSRSYPCTYEWDTTRFPDVKAFGTFLEQHNIKMNLWMNPYISSKGELYKKIYPYTASHTVWCGVVPDYSMAAARNAFTEHIKKHLLSNGVSGLKMDENDGYDEWLWPDVTTFPSGHAAEQMRQTYGSIMQKMTFDLYHQYNQRTFGLVRAGNAGTSPFPYVIYNDYYNHRDFITALINSSFIGVLWTPEVRSSSTADEWLRRMQTACFSPLCMLNAWADGTKPWTFAEVEQDVRDIAQLRSRLLPYLYTAYADYQEEGIPIIRAMQLEDISTIATSKETGVLDATNNPYAMSTFKETKDEYMFGPDLLIAPMFAGEKQRKVILPAGKWYDFYTGRQAGENETITVTPGRQIPVYVRDGAIIPLLATKKDGTIDNSTIEARHYGTKDGSYSLYDDDGTTFNYEKGLFTRVLLTMKGEGAKKKGSCTYTKNKKLCTYKKFLFVKM
jgi:alpha-glucosidase (family GH31 glycosyl hydrolase)